MQTPKVFKRQRPPMPPLAVRVQVAERQFAKKNTNAGMDVYKLLKRDWPLARRLRWLLLQLFVNAIDAKEQEVAPHALDHDPALILRPYNPRIKDIAARYTPHAHDPAALIYREKQDHQQKTTGRKPGAERTVSTRDSDIWLKSKFNRIEGRTKKRPKAKIAQRKNPWPKRKMR